MKTLAPECKLHTRGAVRELRTWRAESIAVWYLVAFMLRIIPPKLDFFVDCVRVVIARGKVCAALRVIRERSCARSLRSSERKNLCSVHKY